METIIQVLGIVVPIVGIGVSAWFANRARISSAEAEDLRRREERVTASKTASYMELLGTFGRMLSNSEPKPAEEEIMRTAAKAATELPLFASDAVVLAFERFMQASYNGAPSQVLLRLYADLVMAVRRDLGYPQTGITATNVLGIRISDIYDTLAEELEMDLDQLCRDRGWVPPWATNLGDISAGGVGADAKH